MSLWLAVGVFLLRRQAAPTAVFFPFAVFVALSHRGEGSQPRECFDKASGGDVSPRIVGRRFCWLCRPPLHPILKSGQLTRSSSADFTAHQLRRFHSSSATPSSSFYLHLRHPRSPREPSLSTGSIPTVLNYRRTRRDLDAVSSFESVVVPVCRLPLAPLRKC